MRIKSFDIGLESITHWDVADEVHLPREGPAAPSFLPQPRLLDSILNRPSLDERLPDFLLPSWVDPGLLDPTALTEARIGVRQALAKWAKLSSGRRREILEGSEALLGADVGLDEEIRTALATLLRA